MSNEVFSGQSADGNSSEFRVSQGFPSTLIFQGGFDSGTVTMEIQDPNGNWVPDPNGISVTSEGFVSYDTSFVPARRENGAYTARLVLSGTAGGAANLTVNVE